MIHDKVIPDQPDKISSLKSVIFTRLFIVGMSFVVLGCYVAIQVVVFKAKVKQLTTAVVIEHNLDMSKELLKNGYSKEVINEAFQKIIWIHQTDRSLMSSDQLNKSLELFIEYGADPGYGLYFAALSGNLEAMSYLMRQNGVTRQDLSNALMASVNNFEAFKLMLEAQIDIYVAMDLAIKYDQFEGASLLIDRGLDINTKGADFLFKAAASPKVIQLLFDKGINLYEGKNRYALRNAAIKGCLECVKLFLDHGFKVSTINRTTYQIIQNKNYYEIQALLDQAARQ